jgi:hypothetical protein
MRGGGGGGLICPFQTGWASAGSVDLKGEDERRRRIDMSLSNWIGLRRKCRFERRGGRGGGRGSIRPFQT